MSRNEITGDEIKSRVNTKAYEDNYDRIFKIKDYLCSICGKELSTVTECAWTSCEKWRDEWDEKRVDVIGQNGNNAEHYLADNLPLAEYPDNKKEMG